MLEAGVPREQVHLALRAGRHHERPAKGAQSICVLPEQWDAVRIFKDLCTQWRVAGGGMGPLIYIGLDYNCLPGSLDWLGIEPTDKRMLRSQIRCMEQTALAALNAPPD
jgi:hypothetical protein